MTHKHHHSLKISRVLSIGALVFAFITGCNKQSSSTNIERTALKSEKSAKEPEKKVNILKSLDADNNGLYDDTERKAMLAVISKECPDLKINFDADGDGKVSIVEQSVGRHPLSQLIPKENILKSDNKIPWSINIFPEWIMTAYLQDDLSVGTVTKHIPRGTMKRDATQEKAVLSPNKLSTKGGIEFTANSGQFLQMVGVKDARWNYRWLVFNFRIDKNSGKSTETTLVSVNKKRGSSYSSPKIWYSKDTGLNIQYLGSSANGTDKRLMVTSNVVADGKTWNTVVCGTRQGVMYASVNGTPLTTSGKQSDRFSTAMISPGNILKTNSFIGDSKNKGNMAWALDSLVFGITEPSEAMVRKISGWAAHRLKTQKLLPSDHPYKNDVPVLDSEDFPHRYVHDNDQWLEWRKSLTKTITRVNAGGARVAPKGFERVFYDDFRTKRISDSTSNDGDLWMAPGFNTAVGGSLQLQKPNKEPDVYPYDSVNKKQTVSLGKSGDRWKGSAFYSINDMGQGYTWDGPKVFRIRCMFPKIPQKELTGGLFPAFWSYGTEWIYWRTSNRIECDWFELDGKSGGWLNGIATHYHEPHVKNIFAQNNEKYKRAKVYGGDLKESKSKIPGGIYMWDGEYHTWEFVVEKDMTYINITKEDKDGNETWYELARAATPATYLERLDIQVNYALHGKNGYPKTERQDFTIDFIEVMQKTSQLKETPSTFSSRPELSGDAIVESVIECKSNLKDISDVRYYWFADGYPLTYGTSNKYTITKAEAGKEIRCMVMAAGALDMPEAWSDKVRV
ncbi:MAG: hypothetical protein NE330_01620, partial [Lentisphaeraceae bacterium]|nr:hypothetical protein [Lentisphaeraceae bacterium]